VPTTMEIARRIPDLLRDPRESLETELKGWLDLTGNEDHRAVLAKASIALANNDGGMIIVGFEERDDGTVAEASGRPANMASWTTDVVNSAILRYAEPPFHCEVQIATSPETGLTYPVILVPGGHTVPIRSRRDGPGGQTIKQSTYYIRRPGPQSQPPQSGQEWDTLMRRCLANARGDLLDQFRMIMAGGAPSVPAEPSESDRLREWFISSQERWNELVAELPAEHYARFPHGHYAFGYQLFDPSLQGRTSAELLDALRLGVVRRSGWPPFWVPGRQEIAPYPYDGNVECWLGRGGTFQDAAHSDFWRVSPRAQFFLMRGYQEDGNENDRAAPGEIFDLTLPIWRTGEVLLHAENMARTLSVPQATVRLMGEWTGLGGRRLTSWANRNRLLSSDYISRQDSYRFEISVQADQISDSLPELVREIVRPLYELFDFFQISANVVTEELAHMRG
jgi:transcriptional regulator with XRE-family HTH domain